ncbi:Serine/Threonine-Protein Kinase Mrck Beta [Manis pentadactyla]|nr:Serine/Threonine-Protein Kinase Mrck Beta [Manis pentadactyla]
MGLLGGGGRAARRSAPTFPCRCARDMPRRTLLPPAPPRPGPSPTDPSMHCAKSRLMDGRTLAGGGTSLGLERAVPGPQPCLSDPTAIMPTEERLMSRESRRAVDSGSGHVQPQWGCSGDGPETQT